MIERILIFFLASLFIASAAWGQQLAPPKERPNILMIVADDMNWDTPGCFGGAALRCHAAFGRRVVSGEVADKSDSGLR